MSAEKLIRQADAIVEADLSEASVDLQSFAATYKAKRDAGDTRAQAAWARAVVRRADFDGVEVKGGGSNGPTVKELEAEIASRNEGRDEDDRIVPASRKKADLEQALAADDAR